MTATDFRFETRWTVQATPDEVFGILSDPMELPRWWPSAYLSADEVERGAADGAGRVVSLVTKGWLPYTLRWTLRVTAITAPREISIEAFGDLEAKGLWTITDRGGVTDVDFVWEVAPSNALVKNFSFILGGAYERNHRWAMERGRESLDLELRRRREADPDARGRIPPAPTATSSAPLPWVLGAVGTLGAIVAGAILLRRRPR